MNREAVLIARGHRLGPVEIRLRTEIGPGRDVTVLELKGAGLEAFLERTGPVLPLWLEFETGDRLDIDPPEINSIGKHIAVVMIGAQLEKVKRATQTNI